MPSEPKIHHRVYFSDLAGASPAEPMHLDGPEAAHAATVKRLQPGQHIEVFDGRGTAARAVVTRAVSGKKAALQLDLLDITSTPAVAPSLEVWCPPPKGDRLETMIEQLSQIGVAAWHPLRTGRAERSKFRVDKLERAAIESAKQCGRDHLLRVGDWIDFAEAIADPRTVIADRSGDPPHAITTDTVMLLGPEGGWTPEELQAATNRPRCRFGIHVMRIETAAVAGAATLLQAATPAPRGTP